MSLLTRKAATASMSSQAFLPRKETTSPAALKTKLAIESIRPGNMAAIFLPTSFRPLPSFLAILATLLVVMEKIAPITVTTAATTPRTVKPYFLKASLTRSRRERVFFCTNNFIVFIVDIISNFNKAVVGGGDFFSGRVGVINNFFFLFCLFLKFSKFVLFSENGISGDDSAKGGIFQLSFIKKVFEKSPVAILGVFPENEYFPTLCIIGNNSTMIFRLSGEAKVDISKAGIVFSNKLSSVIQLSSSFIII